MLVDYFDILLLLDFVYIGFTLAAVTGNSKVKQVLVVAKNISLYNTIFNKGKLFYKIALTHFNEI